AKRLRQAAHRCLSTPMVEAIHYESATRAVVTTSELQYQRFLMEDWGSVLERDPFFKRNLPLDKEQFAGYRAFAVEEEIDQVFAGPSSEDVLRILPTDHRPITS